MDLMTAHTQWAIRPPDERFASVEEFTQACRTRKNNSQEINIGWNDWHIESVNSTELKVVTKFGEFVPTNYAFSQICNKVIYPVGGITDLVEGPKIPANMAADVLNYRLDKIRKDKSLEENLLFLVNKSTNEIRSVTSESYARIYDADLCDFVEFMKMVGLRVPPARPAYDGQPGTRKATIDDIIPNQEEFNLSVKVGDNIAPAGLYSGDRDMFVTMVNFDQMIDDGNGRKLGRAFILSNSEVGAKKISLFEMKLMNVCGNHIFWGVEDLIEIEYRHVGIAYDKTMRALEEAKKRLFDWQPQEMSRQLQILRDFKIGIDRETTINSIYKQRIDVCLTKKILNKAYDTALQYGEVDGAQADTVLGIVHGLTRVSQNLLHADDRTDLDRASGKIMSHFFKYATA